MPGMPNRYLLNENKLTLPDAVSKLFLCSFGRFPNKLASIRAKFKKNLDPEEWDFVLSPLLWKSYFICNLTF